MTAAIGALLLVFASYDFSLEAFGYFLHSGAGRVWFSLQPARHWLLSLPNAAVSLTAVTALLLYLPTRRSRYFGNTVPLLLALLFFTLITPGISSEPSLWALPFLLAFIAGVFADFLETRYRPILLAVTTSLLLLEAALSLGQIIQ
jgi:hypothetical protein